MAIHPDKHIFNPSGCLRLESLQIYMKGGFTEDIREKISMHLEECRFCKEAMEGLTLIPDPGVQNKSIRTIREGMKGRIRKRKMSTGKSYGLKRRFNWVAVAASIILLTGVFSIYNYLLKNDRDYIAGELNVADSSGKMTDSIQDRGIIDQSLSEPGMMKEDKKDVLAFQSSTTHKEKAQAYESDKDIKETIPVEKETPDIVLSDVVTENELLRDSSPPVLVTKELVSSPMAEVIEVEDEMDVLARTEESKEISSEKAEVGGVSAQRGVGATGTRTELEYAAVSSKKTKKAMELGGDINTDRKISLTKPIFHDSEYKDFEDYLTKNLVYPDSALTANFPGRVILEFTIDENGIISGLKVRESSHKIFVEEARRLISSSGIWQPATENGQAVSYLMFLPIDFIPPDKK